MTRRGLCSFVALVSPKFRTEKLSRPSQLSCVFVAPQRRKACVTALRGRTDAAVAAKLAKDDSDEY